MTKKNKQLKTPHISTNSNAQSSTTDLFPYKVTLAILSYSAIVLSLVIAIVKVKQINLTVPQTSASDTASGAFSDITKEEAVTALTLMLKTTDYAPDGFLPSDLRLTGNQNDRYLLYSYDKPADIEQIAAESIMRTGLFTIDETSGQDSFSINSDSNYYATVVNDACKEYCYLGISFDKQFLDHYNDVIKEENYTSSNDIIKFNNTSLDFAKIALPIVISTDSMSFAHDIYDYAFDETSTEISLHTYHIGMGMDMDNLNSFYNADDDDADAIKYFEYFGTRYVPMAINCYEMILILDKTTGEIRWQYYDDDTRMDIIKSFPLTAGEVIELYSGISGVDYDSLTPQENVKPEGDISSEKLSKLVYAVCDGEYSIIYQSISNTGIFQCENPDSIAYKEIYSVTDPQDGTGNYDSGEATFLGTNDDALANQYFSDYPYLVANHQNADIPQRINLLVDASSEDDLLERIAEPLYNYSKALNEEYDHSVLINVFYTDNINDVNSIKDYILISAATGYYSWLPHGNGLGSYAFWEEDSSPELHEIGGNPDLYSSQTLDAIKFHRHIDATIDDVRSLTLDDFRESLANSFKDGV